MTATEVKPGGPYASQPTLRTLRVRLSGVPDRTTIDPPNRAAAEDARMPPDTVTQLRAIPLFRQFGLAELYLLAGIGLEEFVPKGRTLGVEAEPLADLWVILEGRVAVTSPATGRGESIIEAPAAWGVSALVDPFISFGTAVTDTDCRMLRLATVDVRELAARNPRLGVRLYEELASWVFVRTHQLLEEAAARSRRETGG
jgi:CRP-like cAMP-binding protein